MDRRALRISARATEARSRREIYFVVTPATGDLRQVEAANGEPAEEALTRAIGVAAAGDFVAVWSKGSLSRAWTAPAVS